MRFRQLEYLVEVCDCGSITEAARRLNVAQPALGMQIRALENELGVKLLARTRRGTVPTEAGALFANEARAMIGHMRDLVRRVRACGAEGPATVRLGLTPSLARLIGGRLIESLSGEGARSGARGARVAVSEDFSHAMLDAVATNALDLALAFEAPADRFPQRVALLTERLFLIVPATGPLARFAHEPCAIEALADLPFVMPGPRDFIRAMVEDRLAKANLQLTIAYEVDSMAAMRDLILRGIACGILPRAHVADDIATGRLVAVPVMTPDFERTLFAVTASGSGEVAAATATVLATALSLLIALCADRPDLALSPIQHGGD